MKFLPSNNPKKLKGRKNVSGLAYRLLNVLYPVLTIVLVRADLVGLAIALALASKWRMFAVKMRYWLVNVRSNAVDIIVGVSFVIFIAGTQTLSTQLILGFMYAVWLLIIKPRSEPIGVFIQAAVAQFMGLVALNMLIQPQFSKQQVSVVVISLIGTWLVSYTSARHFLGVFDEPKASFLSHFWGLFAVQIVWVLDHWRLFYWFIPQSVLVLSVAGYVMAIMYYLHGKDSLSQSLRRQLISVLIVIILMLIFLSDWQDKTL